MKKYSILIVLFALLYSCEPKPQPVEDIVYADSNKYTMKQAPSAKRGIGFNSLYENDFEAIRKGITWAYNWGTSGFNATIEAAAVKAGVAFVPMVWNGGGNWADAIRNYKKKYPDCEYFLAFNEPNLTDQANMTPTQAAAKWNEVKNLAQELNMKIVAPAMNYGTLAGYSDPIKWYDEFFAKPNVSLDDVSALSLHCYMNNPSALKSYVERFRKYDKPIWMTEFCAWEGDRTAEQQRAYMSDVLNYFEAEPMVERYAWFKYDGSTTNNPQYALRPTGNSKGELTDLGKVYVNLSSYDKEFHYGHNQVIPAEHYCNSNFSEVGNNDWVAGVQLKVSSDETGILEVANFGLPKWLEYKIEPVVNGDYHFIMRYACNSDSKYKILLDGDEIGEIDLPKTGGYTSWQTITTPTLPLKSGKHTVRIVPSKGMISLNWWRYKREGI
ncbi:MAG: DUF5010 C-terminal domain-containing protein [Bacteroidales bacterium]|jgi:hypothetical protein|nr:DUF5010 C-terminal domain-containing protein [Bacteroidales bacterium]